MAALKAWVFLFSVALFISVAEAKQGPEGSLSYDLRATSGTQNGLSYNEIHLGLNWSFTDWLTWRNAIFNRSGTNVKSVNGLDSALLASYKMQSESGSSGIHLFAGPGVRMATDKYSAATLEGGVTIRLAGLNIGVGAKQLSYFDDRSDIQGSELPKSETQYFLTLSGSGRL